MDRRLVDRPDAGGRDFQEVAVGIAKVEALAAPVPRLFFFDCDSVDGEPSFPGKKVGLGNGEGEMQFTIAIVRGGHGTRSPLLEEQKYLAVMHFESTAALAKTSHDAEAKDFEVKLRRTLDVGNV